MCDTDIINKINYLSTRIPNFEIKYKGYEDDKYSWEVVVRMTEGRKYEVISNSDTLVGVVNEAYDIIEYRYREARSCTNKTKHSNADRAGSYLKENQRVYLCVFCHMYHVGKVGNKIVKQR